MVPEIPTGFQSTLPQGERLILSRIRQFRNLFQSTLPQGERRLCPVVRRGRTDFNPRSHKGSDYKEVVFGSQEPQFQSTLPQGERPYTLRYAWLRNPISIHAPTRGATRARDNQRTRVKISIHAPTRGATFWLTGAAETGNFNPRSHKGSDSNFTQNSISVLFHFYQSFPHIIFPHTARFRLLIIFCTFFLVRIAQGFPVCFHFAPKQYLAFYNVCSTDLL